MLTLLHDENVPGVQEILRNLAVIEYIQFAYSKTPSKPIDLLSPVIESIKTITKEGSSRNQLAAIELIDKFSFARVKESLEILWNCWTIERDTVVEDHQIFGKYTIAHKDVKNKVPWKLFTISQYADEKTDLEEVYRFYLSIYEEETEKKVNYTEGSEKTAQLFGRTLFGEYWSYEKYNGLAVDKANELITKIEKTGSLNPTENFAFTTLMAGLTTAEKMVNGPTFDDKFTFGREYIRIGSGKWIQLNQFKEKLKNLLNIPSLDIDLLKECAKLYTDLIHSVNRGLLPIEQNQNPTNNDFFIAEFRWIKEYLIKKGNSLDIKVKDALRESWQWHLKFSPDVHLKQSAEECENAYYSDDTHREIKNFFSHDRSYGREAEIKIKDFFEKWISGKSNNEIIEFLAKASGYDSTGQYDVYARPLGQLLGEQLSKEEQFIELCQLLLAKQNRSYQFEFAISMIKSFLKKVRGTNAKEATDLLMKCLTLTANIPDFLSQYIQFPWDIENVSRVELELVNSNLDKFGNIHSKWRLLTGFIFRFWSETRTIIDKMWPNLPEEEKHACIHAIIEHSSFLDKIEERFTWNKERSQWLIEKIVTAEKIDWLDGENYNIDNYLSLKGLNNITWLLDTINQRTTMFGEAKALPQFFRLTHFVNADFANQNDIDGFDKLIEFSTGDSITAYYLPKYLYDLDPQSIVLGNIVGKKIESTDDVSRIYRLTRIAGEFQSDMKAWGEISLATCKTIQRLKMSNEDKLSLFRALGWSGVRSYSSGYGQVPSLYYEQVEAARKGSESEKHPERKEDWQKKLEWAEQE
ncbi:MAG: hypothetical protein WBW71_16450, partial [Bacteroidota bacterium]